MGEFYSDRYGGMDAIANTAYEDPIGLLLDGAAGVGTAAKLASTGSKIASGPLAPQTRRLRLGRSLTLLIQSIGRWALWAEEPQTLRAALIEPQASRRKTPSSAQPATAQRIRKGRLSGWLRPC